MTDYGDCEHCKQTWQPGHECDPKALQAAFPQLEFLLQETRIKALREAALGWLNRGPKGLSKRTTAYKYLNERADQLNAFMELMRQR